MDFQQNNLLKQQQDLAFLALAYALEGDEAKADHIRAVARARYEASVKPVEEKKAVGA